MDDKESKEPDYSEDEDEIEEFFELVNKLSGLYMIIDVIGGLLTLCKPNWSFCIFNPSKHQVSI
jgi:hypothetical protein